MPWPPAAAAPVSRSDRAADRHLERQLGPPAPRISSTGCRAPPDIVCLQEIKCVDEAFPAAEIEALATMSPFTAKRRSTASRSCRSIRSTRSRRGLPGDEADDHARYHRGRGLDGERAPCGSPSIYLPNGNPAATRKYPYKLAWMERLLAHARDLLRPGGAAGARRRLQRHSRCRSTPRNPAEWVERRPVPAARRAAKFRALINLGLTDAVRACNPTPGLYTFWDYQAGAWQKRRRHPHRSPAAVAAGRRPADRRRHRPARARPGRSRPITCRCGLISPSTQRRSVSREALRS